MTDMQILAGLKDGRIVPTKPLFEEPEGYHVVPTNGGYMIKLKGVNGYLGCIHKKNLAQVICDKLNGIESKPTEE